MTTDLCLRLDREVVSGLDRVARGLGLTMAELVGGVLKRVAQVEAGDVPRVVYVGQDDLETYRKMFTDMGNEPRRWDEREEGRWLAATLAVTAIAHREDPPGKRTRGKEVGRGEA